MNINSKEIVKDSVKEKPKVQTLNLLLIAVVSAILLIFSHGTSWWPQDDGIFAYLADVVLNGAVYGVDVYDFHGGYHTFLNALMFHWFGTDMIVLRYPLIIIGILQAVLVTHMLRRTGTAISLLAGLTAILGPMMFPNPSPNWYALFFAIVSVWILSEFKKKTSTYLLLGFLIGMCLMFRHPSAIFLSMGILTYLLYDSRTIMTQPFSKLIISRFFLGVTGLSIVYYSHMVFEPLAFVIFAVPPLVLLFALFLIKTYDPLAWVHKIFWIGCGFVSAIVPMVIYQLQYGSVVSWVQQSFLNGSNITAKAFFSESSYIDIYIGLISYYGKNIHWTAAVIEAISTVVLLGVPLILFFLWLSRWWDNYNRSLQPAVFVATFFGLVSFYYQIPFYFFMSFATFVLAIGLSLNLNNHKQKQFVAVGLVFINVMLLLNVPAVQAIFQPDLYAPSQINKVSIVMRKDWGEMYQKIYSVVDEYSQPGDVIYVFPFDPDVYFSGERKNRFPFYGSSFSITTEDSYHSLVATLKNDPPTLLMYNSINVYKNEYDEKLYESIKTWPNYTKVAEQDNFIIFALTKEAEGSAE